MKKVEAKDGASEAEILIYGVIGGWDIDAIMFMDELKALGDVKTIHIRIDSPGGSIVHGNNIINALNRHPARIITYVDGQAASMGAALTQTGDERHMSDNTLMMIHNPLIMGFIQAEAEELRKQADVLDMHKAQYINGFSARSSLSQEDVSAMMDEETYFTAEEAKAAGLIDVIDRAYERAACLTDVCKDMIEVGYHVPVEKMISALQDKQRVELAGAMDKYTQSIDKTEAEHTEALSVLNTELASSNEQLAENALKIAQVDDLVAKVEAKDKAIEDLKDEVETNQKAHDTALEEAKKVTDSAVAAQAAVIVGLQTVPPVADNDDNEPEAELDSESFWAEYHAIEDLAKRNEWYAANEHRLK